LFTKIKVFILPLHAKRFAKQTMNSRIRHVGVVDSIEHSHVRVRIVQAAACSACKVASHCNASEAKEKIIDVYTDANGLRIGEEVVVSTSGSTASRATLIGFVIPLGILVGVLFVMKILGYSDEASALWAMGALIPYYICVWLLRERIAKSISFQLERTITN
jgi:sigma-E factor negative regulatory protein RseC